MKVALLYDDDYETLLEVCSSVDLAKSAAAAELVARREVSQGQRGDGTPWFTYETELAWEKMVNFADQTWEAPYGKGSGPDKAVFIIVEHEVRTATGSPLRIRQS